MKSKFLILILLLCSIVSFGQARLGSTSAAIKEEFSKEGREVTSGITDNSIYYLTVTIGNSIAVYYFDDNYVCYSTAIMPQTTGELNGLAERYNSRYVIVSSTVWKVYGADGIGKIELTYSEGLVYFMWTWE